MREIRVSPQRVIWIGRLPEESRYFAAKRLGALFEAEPSTIDSVCTAGYLLHLLTVSHGSFGMLGGTFLPDKTGVLAIEVAVSDSDRNGLPFDMARPVFDTLCEFAETGHPEITRLGSGTLRIDHAMYHEVDSVVQGYTHRVLPILLRLLRPGLEAATDQEIIELTNVK